jgi:hypothetical protein
LQQAVNTVVLPAPDGPTMAITFARLHGKVQAVEGSDPTGRIAELDVAKFNRAPLRVWEAVADWLGP